ncbi:MAG: hypothetical protein IJY36_01075 [Coprobacter sp.]|nr:hypothetical protein [Coprobacter sp.]
MFMTTNQWIDRVKTNMEELTPDWDAVITRTGGCDIEQYIRAKWDEALTRQLLTAPAHLCNPIDITDSLTPEAGQDGSGRVVLPADLLRMVRYDMKGWRRPVTKFITSSHPDYLLQHNRYARGGAAKPVAAIVPGDAGRLVLEYYSVPHLFRRHIIRNAVYIATPHETEGGYDLSPLLGDSVCYLCAALVYEILGENDKAATMYNKVLF